MPNGNNKVISRQLRRSIARNKANYGKANVQTALNNLLWKIVVNNNGIISISRSELDQIPPNATLEATFDSATNRLVVVTGLRPGKDGIVENEDEV